MKLYLDPEPTNENALPGKGGLSAPFAFVGIAPSTRRPKGRANEPFGASSHRMLKNILGAAPENVYVTNLVKEPVKPGKNPGVKLIRKYYPGMVQELKAMLDYQDRIPRVLALGAVPAKALCPGFQKLRDDHGTFFYNPEIESYVVPTFHFAAVARDPLKGPMLARDLQRFFELPDPESPSIVVLHTPSDFRPTPRVYLDIETAGEDALDPYHSSITRIGLLREGDGTAYVILDPTQGQLKELRSILEETQLIGHNFAFDLYHLDVHTGEAWENASYDTMLMWHVLGEPVLSLKHLSTMKTDRPGPRSFGGTQSLDYLAEDLFSTSEIFQLLPEQCTAQLLLNALVPKVARMRWQGVEIDKEKLEELLPRYEQGVENTRAKLNSLAQYEVNWNSPMQVADFLKEQDVPLRKKTPTGRPSVAEDVLLELQPNYSVVGQILGLREQTKELEFLQSYTGFMEDAGDGRLHPRMKLAGTRTGRLSCADPNLQQVKRTGPVKTLFISRFEKGFIGLIDLSQAELRVAALLSNDPLFAEFILKEDPHQAIAAMAYQVPEDQVSALQRKKSKGVTFGLLYGGSPEGLARRTGASVQEVEHILSAVLGSFKGLNTWLDNTGSEAIRTLWSTTLFGRQRDLSPVAFSEGEGGVRRKAVNTPIQSLASDITLQIFRATDDYLHQHQAKTLPLFGVHDSTLLDVYPDEVDLVVEAVRYGFNSLSQTPLKDLPLWGALPIVGELILGKTWAHTETTNENYNPVEIFPCSSGDLQPLPPKEVDDEWEVPDQLAADMEALFGNDDLWE